ncbi:hypothetical protein GBAR_LOCUS23946 [Geodia barretti]|uniref:Uncharacterized protein n=1 Tax=Geodia barretti TaxID=519541 RepID=A0AA35T8E2_GEOBA|nr:hypothetical protein GBAR_LOCUS23946 [Geodia barretti]
MSSAVSQSLIDGRFHFAAEMISQCVTDGTELSFLCPIDDEVDWYFYHMEDYDSVQDPVLPFQLFLEKGKGENFTISWNNPPTTFTSIDNINYEYSIRVNVTDGPQTTYTYQSEAHDEGARYEAPEQFQENAASDDLFSTDRQWKSVVISFTPPVMCPQQEASYILSFDDGEEEEWSRDPVEIESSGASVEVILDTDKEPCLKRERNYTLRVTLVTEYANVSSQTDFRAITNLRVVGYNESRVNLAWNNPAADYHIPVFIYSVTVSPPNSKITTEPFLQEEDPFISIDLKGLRMRDNSDYSSTLWRRRQRGSISKCHTSIILPDCESQRASYMLVISGGNKTWSTSPEPVVISDSRVPVKIELETGFSLNTFYTANVTVFMNTTNISSSNNFSFNSPTVNGFKSVRTLFISFRCVIITGGWSTGRSRMSAGGSTALWVWDWDGSCLPAQKEEREEAKRNSEQSVWCTTPYTEAVETFYEELPEDTPPPLNLNGASAVPATSLPPS